MDGSRERLVLFLDPGPPPKSFPRWVEDFVSVVCYLGRI